jgi:hypothetical protein
MARIPTIPFQNVREFYAQMQPNGYWFDAKTIKFFGSRLPKVAYATDAGLLFISSELDYDHERRYYNVRRQTVDGDIKTVGQFNAYRTRAEAMNAVRALHQSEGV